MAYSANALSSHSTANGRNFFRYDSGEEASASTLATIVADDYLLGSYRRLGVGDLIYIEGSDANGFYEVTASSSSTVTLGSALTGPSNRIVVQAYIADISTAQSAWCVSPVAGTIETIYSVIHGAISVADATLTTEIGGTLVTGSSITVANSGSAAGDVDSATPTAANTVTAGGAIEAITDGGSTTAAECDVFYVIQPT